MANETNAAAPHYPSEAASKRLMNPKNTCTDCGEDRVLSCNSWWITSLSSDHSFVISDDGIKSQNTNHGISRAFQRFGNNAPELAKRFFDWCTAAFADGSAREKSLIALAVAHAVRPTV